MWGVRKTDTYGDKPIKEANTKAGEIREEEENERKNEDARQKTKE